MLKCLILVAGFPGTGKSYLCRLIIDKYPAFCLYSPDMVKEAVWDEYGFTCIEEKKRLISLSWQRYYGHLDELLQNGCNVISDYPFSGKQLNQLNGLSERYGYKVITIRMTAAIDVLFERQLNRDLDSTRHWGHILNSYDPKCHTYERSQAEGLLDYEEFKQRCLTRGYDKFELGDLLTLDVTDFSKADYTGLLNDLNELMFRK